jgi:hypothetical protein
MTLRAIFPALVCAAALTADFTQTASASEVIYDGSGFLTGQQSFEDSFSVSGPGTLTVTLTNFAWPVELANLNLVVGTAQGLLGPEMGVGTESFAVTGGKVFAQWFGTAQGPMNAGSYGLKIEFTQSAATVPLPASIALLLSGLALLAWQRRERAGSGHAHSNVGVTA